MNMEEAVIRPPENLKEKRIYEVFEIAIVLKGLNAILEIILGVLLLSGDLVNEVVLALAQNEFIEDPNNFFTAYLHTHLSLSPHAQFVGALYLLVHGSAKVFLVSGLLLKKMWAFPATMAILSLFICYQMIRFASTHSLALLFLSIFDTFVVWLVYHEYKRFQSKVA